jgi:capsular polysaccharide transport system permease protein
MTSFPESTSLHSSARTSLWDSFGIQMRVIGALLMREILDRYGRHNLGFLWIFVEPMLFTLAVTTLWSVIGLSHGSDFPIVAFAVTGYSAVLLWRNMPNRCVRAVQPNHTLMHHRNIKLIDIYSARLLLEAGGAGISFTLLIFLFTSLGWMDFPEDPLKVFFGWMMLAWFGCSLALFVGALSERADIVHILWHPTSYILFPLSGAAFSVDTLPTVFQHAVLLLPMVHGVEIIREGYFGTHYLAHYDMAYMASCNLVLMLLGMTQVREVSRRVVA